MKADGFGDDPDHVESLLCAQSFYFSEPLKGGGLQAIAGKNGSRLVIFVIIFLLFLIKRKNIEKYQERIIPCSKNYNSSHPNFPYKLSQMSYNDKVLNSCTPDKPRCEGYIPNQKLGKCIGPPLRKKNDGNYEFTIKTDYKKRGNFKGRCFGKEIPNTKSYTTYENCKNQCDLTDYCQGFEYDYNKELCTLFNKSNNAPKSNCYSNCNQPVILRQHFQQHNWGWEAPFYKGHHNTVNKHGARNDDASSMVVPKGCIAHIFEHYNFGGTKVTYGEGRHNIHTHGIPDNNVSSIIVEDDLDNTEFIEKKPEIKTIIDKTSIDYNDVHKDPLYNCLDPRYPYSDNNGEKCYNNYRFVNNRNPSNSDSCNNWCTNKPEKVNRCGKLCNTIQKSIINDETCSTKINGICERDTQFIISHEVNKYHTTIYTKLNPNGIKIANKNIGKTHETIKVLLNIKSIYIYSNIATIYTNEQPPQKIYISKKSSKYFKGKGLENVDNIYLVIPYTSHYIQTDNGAVIAKNNCGESEHLAKSSKVTDLSFKSIKTEIEMAKAVGDNVTQQIAERKLAEAKRNLNQEEKNALALGMTNVEKAKGMIKINKNKRNMKFIEDEYIPCKYDYGTHKDCDNKEVDPRDTCPEYKRYCVGYDNKNKYTLGVCQDKNINSCKYGDAEENCLIGRKILYIIPNKTKHWNVTKSKNKYHPDYYRKCNYDWKNKVGLDRHLPLKKVNNVNFDRTAKVDMDINCIQAKEEAKKCNLVFVKDSITNQPYLIKGKNKPSCKMSINNRNFWEDSDYYGPKATENVNDCIKRLSQKKDGQPYNRYYMKYTNCNGEVQENIDHQNPMRLPRNDFQYEYTGCYTDNSSRNLKNGPGYMGGPFDIKKCLKECRYSKYVALQDGGGSCFCDDQIKGQKRSFAECNKGDKQGFGKGNSWRNAVYRNDKYNTSQYPIEQYNYTPWTYMGNKEKELNWLLKHNIKCDNKGYLNSINFKPYSSKWFYYKNKCINHDKKKIMRNYSTFPRYHRNPKINNLKSHEIKCNRGLLNRMQLKKSGNNIRYDYTCNTGVKTKNCTQHFTPFSKVPGGSLQNAGRDCWNSCGRRGGLCNWCGSGKCCRQNWHNRYVRDSTCKPNEGGRRDHVCVAHKHPQKANDLKSQLNCPGKKGISKIKMENLVVKNCGSIVGETIKLIKYIEGRPGCIYNMWSKMIARDTGDNIRFDRWPPGRPGDNRYWGEWGSDERFTIYPIYENGQVTDRIIMKGGKHNQNCGRQRGKSKILCKGNQGDIARNNDGSVQELQLHLVGGKFNPSLGAWPVYITEIDKFGKNKRWVIPGKERHGAEVHTWGRDPKGDIFIIGNPRSVKQYDGIMNGCHRELPEGTVLPGHRFSYTCCDAE